MYNVEVVVILVVLDKTSTVALCILFIFIHQIW